MSSSQHVLRNWLGILASIAILESFFGWLPYTPVALIASLALILFSTRTSSAVANSLAKSKSNSESAYITALILFFILTPIGNAAGALLFIVAGIIAVASKYVFVYGKTAKTHIFNPAALTVLILSFGKTDAVTWWVGTVALLPFVLVLGFIVLRKIGNFRIFFISIFAAIIVFVGKGLLAGGATVDSEIQGIVQLFSATPLVFLAAVMLTDPQTSPLKKQNQTIYAAIVGGLYSAVSFSPAFALVVGNLFTVAIEKRKRVALSLHKRTKILKDVYEFSFLPSESIHFAPGQYIEITLPHTSSDNRSAQRTFSFVSDPSDEYIKFAIHIPTEHSTFKEALLSLKKDSKIFAKGVAGSSFLKIDPSTKILAFADGIGIVSFVSFFRYLYRTHQRRDIVLIYTATTPVDFAYRLEIESIKDAIGLTTLYVPLDFTELSSWDGPSGELTQEFIQKEVPDFATRTVLLDYRTYVRV